MPYLETPRELAEALADMLYIYGTGNLDEARHDIDCPCRICWTATIEERIKAAQGNEELLAGG